MPKKKGKEEQTLDEKLKMAIVPKEEEPYRVPDNWVWTRLEDISYNFQVGLVKSALEQSEDKEYKYLKMNNITNDGKLTLDQLVCVDATLEEYEKFKLKKGDFLFNTRNSYELVGKNTVFDLEGDYLYNNNILKINFYEGINSKVISYYLNSPMGRDRLTEIKSGTTNVSAIYAKDLKKIMIALPPIDEQKRIVNKLDYFFDKIQKVKEIIEEVKEKNEARKESILSKAFTGELTAKWRADNIHSAKELLNKISDEKLVNWEQECQKAEAEGRKKPTKPKLKSIDEMIVPNDEIPYEIPNNWVWTTLGDISEVNPKKVSLSYDDEEQISFVPMKAVSEITGKIEDLEFERYGKLKKGYTQFIEEDVLFAKITPCMENGKCAIAKNLKDKVGYGTTEFHVLRTNKYFDNRFLFNFLRQESFRKDAQYHMTGSVGFRRVPTEYLKEFIFPLPPIEEQKEIVRILDNIFTKENLINELISLEDKIQALEKSILDKAFRGELGTNSKDDIEAMELLKEIL